MIHFWNVTKGFRTRSTTKVILQDASLTLRRGRNYGVIGRNGAGKTTLLRMMAGVIAPNRGRVVRTASVSWPLGFGGAFHGELTGVQNARFIARVYGIDTDSMVTFVRDFAELGSFYAMPVATYSSGMRARLAFAISMAIPFEVYLVDEITAVGDAAFRTKCRAAFRDRVSSANLVIVSHSLPTIRDYCDAVIVLEGGRLMLFDDVDDGIAHHQALIERSA